MGILDFFDFPLTFAIIPHTFLILPVFSQTMLPAVDFLTGSILCLKKILEYIGEVQKGAGMKAQGRASGQSGSPAFN